MGIEDAHRIVLLGLMERLHERIRECHRLVLGALVQATPKDTLGDDEYPEEEDGPVLALATVLAAQVERWSQASTGSAGDSRLLSRWSTQLERYWNRHRTRDVR